MTDLLINFAVDSEIVNLTHWSMGNFTSSWNWGKISAAIVLPTLVGYDPFLQLMAGWNLLVQIGVALGINLDKPQRARKIGNEFEG